MNKTLAEEEFERDLVLSHERSKGDGKTYDSILTCKVGKKSVKFNNPSYRKEQIVFSKDRWHGEDQLEITLRHPKSTTLKCSLGHEHVIEEKYGEYTFMHIPWEHVESLRQLSLDNKY